MRNLLIRRQAMWPFPVIWPVNYNIHNAMWCFETQVGHLIPLQIMTRLREGWISIGGGVLISLSSAQISHFPWKRASSCVHWSQTIGMPRCLVLDWLFGHNMGSYSLGADGLFLTLGCPRREALLWVSLPLANHSVEVSRQRKTVFSVCLCLNGQSQTLLQSFSSCWK